MIEALKLLADALWAFAGATVVTVIAAFLWGRQKGE